jgi:hypothetical protein
MAFRKSVRIYDLARELKQDTKRVMEDLRRAGADVSVASNSVSAEFAEKVRSKYFPKTEIAPKRAIKVIKASKKEDTPLADEIVETEEAFEIIEAPHVEVESEESTETHVETPVETAREEEPKAVKVKKLVAAKVKPAVAEPVIAEVEPEAEKIEVAETIPAETVIEEPVETATPEFETEASPGIVSRSGNTVKTLTLTRDAIQKGIKPGDRLVSEAPTQTGRLIAEQRSTTDPRGRRPEFRGTPGETAAPQLTYTPPTDNRRRPGRSGGRKGKTFCRTRSGRTASAIHRGACARSGRCGRSGKSQNNPPDRRRHDPRICRVSRYYAARHCSIIDKTRYFRDAQSADR